MKRVEQPVLAVLVMMMALPGVSAAQDVLFYNGVYDQRSGPVSIYHGTGSMMIYDNFTVGGYGWHVTGAYASFIAAPGTVWSELRWEIRQGIQTGDGGELLFSGVGYLDTPYDATSTDIFTSFNRAILGMDFHLAPGDYWYGVALVSPGPDFVAAIGSTSGAGGYNADYPVNMFANYTGVHFAEPWNFHPTSPDYIPQSHQSLAMTGFETVPEPATMTLLATGLMGLAGASRRQRR